MPESRLETEDRWQERLVTKDRLCKGYYARFTETEPPLADPHERWCERTGARRPLLLDSLVEIVGVFGRNYMASSRRNSKTKGEM